MEITNIVKTYNAKKGNSTVEWRINAQGQMQGLTAQIYGEQGEYLGNCSVNADGGQSAYSANGTPLTVLAAELAEMLAWIDEYEQGEQGEEEEPENEQ